MTAQRWSPGPWRALADDLKPRAGMVYVEGPTGWLDNPICDCGLTLEVEENEANARLITATPELYEALTDMLAGWRYIREHHGDLYGVGWDRCENSARAALAKARGETE